MKPDGKNMEDIVLKTSIILKRPIGEYEYHLMHKTMQDFGGV